MHVEKPEILRAHEILARAEAQIALHQADIDKLPPDPKHTPRLRPGGEIELDWPYPTSADERLRLNKAIEREKQMAFDGIYKQSAKYPPELQKQICDQARDKLYPNEVLDKTDAERAALSRSDMNVLQDKAATKLIEQKMGPRGRLVSGFEKTKRDMAPDPSKPRNKGRDMDRD